MEKPIGSRALFRIALFGAGATALVVGASALLRIAAHFDAGGNATSVLPATLEAAVRLAHRLGASAAGLAALAAAVIVAVTPPWKERFGLTAAIVALTTFLALAGRYSTQAPGAAIPVANALGGTLLACGFAALAVQCYRSWPVVERPAGTAVLVAAFVLVLGATVSGVVAASSTGRVMKPWHVGLGIAILGVVAYSALHGYAVTRSRRALRLRRLLFALAPLQLVLGMTAAALGESHARSVVWLHVTAGLALAIALASLAARALRPREAAAVASTTRGAIR